MQIRQPFFSSLYAKRFRCEIVDDELVPEINLAAEVTGFMQISALASARMIFSTFRRQLRVGRRPQAHSAQQIKERANSD